MTDTTTATTPRSHKQAPAAPPVNLVADTIMVADKDMLDQVVNSAVSLIDAKISAAEKPRNERLDRLEEMLSRRSGKQKTFEDVLRSQFAADAEGKFDLDAIRAAAREQADAAVGTFYKEAAKTAPKTFHLNGAQIAGIAVAAVAVGVGAGIGGTILVQRRRSAMAVASFSATSDSSSTETR